LSLFFLPVNANTLVAKRRTDKIPFRSYYLISERTTSFWAFLSSKTQYLVHIKNITSDSKVDMIKASAKTTNKTNKNMPSWNRQNVHQDYAIKDDATDRVSDESTSLTRMIGTRLNKIKPSHFVSK
jgi:hypothetical protein